MTEAIVEVRTLASRASLTLSKPQPDCNQQGQCPTGVASRSNVERRRLRDIGNIGCSLTLTDGSPLTGSAIHLIWTFRLMSDFTQGLSCW